jgi:hypothetical protein
MRVNLLNMEGQLVASKLISTLEEADAFFCLIVDALGAPLVPVVEYV